MSDNKHFDHLVTAGHPIGDVVAVTDFLVKIHGMQPVNNRSLVMFEDGSKGYVTEVRENYTSVLHLGDGKLNVGTKAVVQHDELVTKVGKDFIGRVINVFGEPLDGKGPIAADGIWPVFNDAPPLYEREGLSDLLPTGVIVIDSMLPLIKGQRLAVLGDSKSGKSSLATQIATNQSGSEEIVVYVMIAKRKTDIANLLSKLEQADVIKNCIVVVSTIFDSLISSYLAPYVGCALAEYLWQKCDRDVCVIYDDLTNHAHIYREVSLLSRVSPGRDSYPGDMFYAHSSLLERAGKLKANHKTFTALPLVLVDGGDIAAYLPTNIMSITDGQWILDMKVFKDTMRPAVNVGLSVSRVSGVGHTQLQKTLTGEAQKLLADYEEAKEFSHFGSELALETQSALTRGKMLFQLMNQPIGEHYSVMAQTLAMDIVLHSPLDKPLDITKLKMLINETAKNVASKEDYEKAKTDLINQSQVELKK
jgi:F-type H+-transporting ATPase subunit alpha